ncbi:hypothetical protein TNCV_228611 [Trichonephila clavipes]|nr:hypothetical protein TNCV_228611 [Trichonephila clavipes]
MSRINIKFLVRLKKFATKTFQILTKAYGDGNLSRVHLFEWHKKFSGRMVRKNAEEDEPAGPPRSAITDQNIAKIGDMRRFPLTSDH